MLEGGRGRPTIGKAYSKTPLIRKLSDHEVYFELEGMVFSNLAPFGNNYQQKKSKKKGF